MVKLLIWKIKDVSECINEMQDEKFDCIICVEGKRGLGKSTLSYKICSRVKSPFNPYKDICYSRKQVIKSLATKIKGNIFADEMINVAFNRDFYEEDQKLLIKGLNMYRDSFNIFIFCVPFFTSLDTQLQRLVKLRLTIIRRGIALVQTPVSSIYSNDPWDIKNNQRIESSWNKKGIKKPRYGQLTTVRGFLKFGDLSKKSKELYEKIKHEKSNRIFEKEAQIVKETSPNAIFYKNLVERLKTKTITKEMLREICIISGKKYRNVTIRINEILREKNEKERLKDLLKANNNTTGKLGKGLFNLKV
jgi:hypothetical protein